jgi:hypothetical protein
MEPESVPAFRIGELHGRSENRRPGKGRADGLFLCACWQCASGVPLGDHVGSCSDWNCSISGHMSAPIPT